MSASDIFARVDITPSSDGVGGRRALRRAVRARGSGGGRGGGLFTGVRGDGRAGRTMVATGAGPRRGQRRAVARAGDGADIDGA